MLAITEKHLRAVSSSLTSAIDISILSVATAVPANVVTQHEVAERAKAVWPQFHKLEQLYANTGIERRYACEPQEWYLKPHGWEERIGHLLPPRAGSARTGRAGCRWKRRAWQ